MLLVRFGAYQSITVTTHGILDSFWRRRFTLTLLNLRAKHRRGLIITTADRVIVSHFAITSLATPARNSKLLWMQKVMICSLHNYLTASPKRSLTLFLTLNFYSFKKSGHTSQHGYILQTSNVYSSDEDISPPAPKKSKGATKTSTPKRRKKSRKTQNQVETPPEPSQSGAPTSAQSKDEVAT